MTREGGFSMALSFSSGEAKQIVVQFRGMQQDLRRLHQETLDARSAVAEAVSTLRRQEAERVLASIPVEELNADKAGFRIKTLREGGFDTMAAICRASPQDLSRLNGISPESAAAMKRVASIMEGSILQNTHITLSYDEKTPETTTLVKNIYIYGRLAGLDQEGAAVEEQYGSSVDAAVEALSRVQGPFRRLFASRTVKEEAETAYQVLRQVAESDFTTRCARLMTLEPEILSVTGEKVWDDFVTNPITYSTTLEKVVPGALGKDDGSYGLPEEIARAVETEAMSTGGLKCTLRRYQEWGVRYILHQGRVLLGDEMGLGKTVEAIAAMVSLSNTGATHFLVVCPASVLINWGREIRRFSTLQVTKVHGEDRQECLERWMRVGGAAVTTYETLGRIQFDPNFKFSMLVVDEAHYIKNPEAQRTKNVKKLCLQAERLLFMTGTALENNVDEMIALIKILRPDLALSLKGVRFLAAAPAFRKKVADVYYRRRRVDVLSELPQKIESPVWVRLEPREQDIYEKSVLDKKYAEARRVSWNVGNLDESSKAQAMMEIIENATADGRKILVFSFFLDTIRVIQEYLGYRCMGPINGSVSPSQRQAIVDAFEKAPAGTVLAAQIQSGGTGLNIQAASVVIICEPQFKPSLENQAISRAYRMGQARTVEVFRLLAEDTVDEGIVNILNEKQKIFDAFADKSEAAQETAQIDDKTFSNIIQQEVDRINARQAELRG